MKIREIINYLENQGEWVNRDCTRDHILYGEDMLEVQNVMICWVATLEVIHQAIDKNCHFIITHENPFYLSSTNLPTLFIEAQEEKKALLKKYQITIYRCHDLWDLYPHYGVRDRWSEILKMEFKETAQQSFIKVSENFTMTVKQLAKHIIECIAPYYENGVQIIGNQEQTVHCLGIGTGACTDILDMYKKGADVCLVSDDGINNWSYTQWAVDHHIPLIVVNHLTSEAAGLEGLCIYLSQHFSNIEFEYIANDYGIHHIERTLD